MNCIGIIIGFVWIILIAIAIGTNDSNRFVGFLSLVVEMIAIGFMIRFIRGLRKYQKVPEASRTQTDRSKLVKNWKWGYWATCISNFG